MAQEHVYEGLFILDSEVYARNPEEVSRRLSEAVEALGGAVRVSRFWEDRKLAYPIKNKTHGAYWLMYFSLDTAKVATLNRQFQLNGDVLRFLLQVIDFRLVETIVEHALLGPVKRDPERENSDEIYSEREEDDEEDDVDVVDVIEQE